MAKTDMSAIQEEQDDIESSGGFGSGGVPTIKWEEGTIRLRLIPPPEGMRTPWKKVGVSFSVGPNKKVLTPRRQFGLEPCPLSDRIDKLSKKTDKVSLAEVQRIKIKTRYKMFVVDRQDEEAGAKLMDLNVMVMKELLKFFADPEFGDLSDPAEGRDIKVTYTPKEKTKGKKFPEWSITPGARESPLKPKEMTDEDYDVLVGTNYFDLYRIGYPSSVEYMEAVIAGKDEEFEGSRSTLPNGDPIPREGDAEAPADDEDADKPAASGDTTESGDTTDDGDANEDLDTSDATGEEEDEAVAAAVAAAEAAKAAAAARKAQNKAPAPQAAKGPSQADKIRERLKGGKK